MTMMNVIPPTSTTKKRKTETPEQAQQHDAMAITSSTTTAKRVRKSAVKHTKPAYEHPAFVQLKRDLLAHERQTLLAEYQPLLDGSRPDLCLPEDDDSPPAEQHPSFVTAALVDLRWQLAAWENLYHRPSGDVLVMGQEDTGQLGILRDVKELGVPATVLREMTGRQTIQVAAGGMHSVALTADGQAYSWGCPDDGALGRVWPPGQDDDEAQSTLPAKVTGLIPSQRHAVSQHVVHSPQDESHDVVMIAAGTSHTLFLTISGNVYSTGMYKDPDSGKFRDPRPGDDPVLLVSGEEDDGTSPHGSHPTPVHVYRLPGRVKFVASGGSCNAAILQDDSLVTWGMGFMGELARSQTMVQGCVDREDPLQKPLGVDQLEQLYLKVVDGKKIFFPDAIRDKFLKPSPVIFANGRKDMIVTHVDMGEQHLLVCARAPGEPFSRAYSAGAGAYGKLGHGNELPRHALTLVRLVFFCRMELLLYGIDFHIIV